MPARQHGPAVAALERGLARLDAAALPPGRGSRLGLAASSVRHVVAVSRQSQDQDADAQRDAGAQAAAARSGPASAAAILVGPRAATGTRRTGPDRYDAGAHQQPGQQSHRPPTDDPAIAQSPGPEFQ